MHEYSVEVLDQTSGVVSLPGTTELLELQLTTTSLSEGEYTGVVEVVVPGPVGKPGPPGPAGPNNLAVGAENTLTGPGLWVQTMGEDFTIWIEDGS